MKFPLNSTCSIFTHTILCVCFFLMSYFYFTELGTLAFTEEMTEVAQAPKDQDGSFFGKLCCKPQCQSALNEEAGLQVFLKRSWWRMSGALRERPSTLGPAEERAEEEKKQKPNQTKTKTPLGILQRKHALPSHHSHCSGCGGFGRLKRTSAGRGWSSLGPARVFLRAAPRVSPAVPPSSPGRAAGSIRAPPVSLGSAAAVPRAPGARPRGAPPSGVGPRSRQQLLRVQSREARAPSRDTCSPRAPPSAPASRRDSWRPGEGGSDGGSTSGSTSGSAEASGSTSGSAGPAPRWREGERERAARRLGPRGFLPAPGAAPFCKGEDGGSVGGVLPCPWFSAEPAESP